LFGRDALRTDRKAFYEWRNRQLLRVTPRRQPKQQFDWRDENRAGSESQPWVCLVHGQCRQVVGERCKLAAYRDADVEKARLARSV